MATEYGYLLTVPAYVDEEVAQAMKEIAISEWRASARRAGYEVFEEPRTVKMLTDNFFDERAWLVEGIVEKWESNNV